MNRSQIVLNMPIKTIGLHKVPVTLHPEVDVTIKVAVARSADEAARLERGEDITVARDEGEEAADRDRGSGGGLLRARSARCSARAGRRSG